MSHQCIVAKIDKIEEIPGANNICSAYVLGTRVIVSKEKKVGDIGLFCPTENQLSHEFCHHNNLYRHKELNKDEAKGGFFESNRRIRTQKFLKTPSDGFFIELSSLEFTGYDINLLKLGDQFDELNGVKIISKYVSQRTLDYIAKNRIKKPRALSAPSFLPHVDTEQFNYYVDRIPAGSLISIFSKYHGTSGRYSLSRVYKILPRWKQWINKVIPIFKTEEYQYLVGTRRVVLFEKDEDKKGFHGPETFRFEWLEKLKPYLTKNLVVYGELVGWANGNTIMPKHDVTKLQDKAYVKKYGNEIIYKYGCQEGESDFIIYRISMVNDDGASIDFTPYQVQNWCETRGFKYAKQLIPSFIYDGDKERLVELVTDLTERLDKLTEDYIDFTHISEGVVVRVDCSNPIPLFYKNKSFAFKVMEGIAKENEVDLEDAADLALTN